VLIAGNHEWPHNYSFFNYRIRNPLYKFSDNHYQSFNWQGIHFVSINSDFFLDESGENKQRMVDWIENDLNIANSPQNREKGPCVGFVRHRPIYSSSNPTPLPEKGRCYYFYGQLQEIDEIVYKHKVDLVLTGHVHYYERLGPIYRNQSAGYIPDPEDPHIMINPETPIHIVEGIPGQNVYLSMDYTPNDMSVLYDTRWGFGEIYATKGPHGDRLVYQHKESRSNEIVDYLYIDKRPIMEGINSLRKDAPKMKVTALKIVSRADNIVVWLCGILLIVITLLMF